MYSLYGVSLAFWAEEAENRAEGTKMPRLVRGVRRTSASNTTPFGRGLHVLFAITHAASGESTILVVVKKKFHCHYSLCALCWAIRERRRLVSVIFPLLARRIPAIPLR